MCRSKIVVLIALCLIAVSAQAVPNQLVAHFTFDGNLLDSSGNGYTGGAGGLVGQTHYVDGRFGQALDFDGDADFIQLMVASDGMGGWVGEGINDQTAVSYDMWIKMDAYQTHDAGILSSREWYWGDTNLEVHSYFGFDKVYLINVQGAVPAENPVATIPQAKLDQWVHLIATYDSVAGEAKIYLDDVLVSQVAIAPGRVVDIGNYTLGGNALFGRWFDGQIDDLKIYNYAIPEPATISLLVVGISALIRRRK
ncbi:MAG: hypothetical protein A2Y10_16905 [Planctomycetes bacterium GWF2_41_51]|nr:MAG: hypothetical protein A2Y10_16905 [Planctomycetes bacterium GWF2_41_51]HBG28090.1 hypothetical protein [Phycisphaerales bacterium]